MNHYPDSSLTWGVNGCHLPTASCHQIPTSTSLYIHIGRHRMACLGQPTNKEEERLVRCILEAKRRAIAAMKPGVTCGKIWTIATRTLDKGGFGHLVADTSMGHGVGLEIHEWPTLSRDSQVLIEENMVFCVEPWTLDYSDWSMGRNHEDMVRVTADGTELLSEGFQELVILPLAS